MTETIKELHTEIYQKLYDITSDVDADKCEEIYELINKADRLRIDELIQMSHLHSQKIKKITDELENELENERKQYQQIKLDNERTKTYMKNLPFNIRKPC